MSVSLLRVPSVQPVWMRSMATAACVRPTGPVPTVTKVEVLNDRSPHMITWRHISEMRGAFLPQ